MALDWQATLLPFGMDVMRLTIWFALLAAVFVPLERLFALRPKPVFRKAIAADVGYYFLSSLLPGFVLGLPLAVLAAAAHRYMPAPIQDAVGNMPLWLKLPLGLLIGEIGAYWGHRWTHEIPFLWQFHEIHHEAEHMDWLVNTRAHPIDMVFVRLCTLVPLYVVGLGAPTDAAGTTTPALVLVIGAAWGFFVHANVQWRFGPAEHLVATPAFHHWHHTLSGPINRNYAPMFPWLDRIFGTLHLPRTTWPAEYGVAATGPAPRQQPAAPAGRRA